MPYGSWVSRMNQKNDIIEMFGAAKIWNRYNMLYQEMNDFIIKNDFIEFVAVNQMLLEAAIYDYFCDMYEFHKFNGTNHANAEKVISHTAYWLLNWKPLQVCCEQKKHISKFATINERFVLLYVLNYLSDRLGDIHILVQSNNDMDDFSERLFCLFVNGVQNVSILEFAISLFLRKYIDE